MPLFDLTTNVKEVPENFHKETTELVAQLLGGFGLVSEYLRVLYIVLMICLLTG